ncbi:LLM class F420-dependent oxidoreductase [Nocardioides bruguierae]|uniref:LLM class F420-dependent oxidoreductase n=1 Tax=Nocardioides bruguierae TaxID=2945102 RepID=UPI0020205782|nr:LLM class F420-dependent oxidoreductase [Nocardioides bruguierae]MCL8027303.1 LLM class F420-dependent oxidoreductase [Nocardioides bruguierae]
MTGEKTDLRIFTEPQQGATYDDLLAVAREAEELGYGAFFRSDHYLTMGGDGLPGPTDAWTTLAGLARETRSIRLGTLVTSATFRHPGPLAVQVAQVDQMSGGRVDLGLGSGWFEAEHRAYGIPFPSLKERFEKLAEQLELITGLWATEGGYSFDGTHYQVTDSPGLPKPVNRSGRAGGVPVLVGGSGKRKTPALAARFADEFNTPFAAFEDALVQNDRVRAACEAIDRDPSSMTFSAALVLCVGEDEAEVARRAAAIGREVPELRENGLAGTPEEVVEKIARYTEAGHSRLYLQVLDLADLDHLRLVAEQVMPHV